jgi:hypothetical protein
MNKMLSERKVINDEKKTSSLTPFESVVVIDDILATSTAVARAEIRHESDGTRAKCIDIRPALKGFHATPTQRKITL